MRVTYIRRSTRQLGYAWSLTARPTAPQVEYIGSLARVSLGMLLAMREPVPAYYEALFVGLERVERVRASLDILGGDPLDWETWTVESVPTWVPAVPRTLVQRLARGEHLAVQVETPLGQPIVDG